MRPETKPIVRLAIYLIVCALLLSGSYSAQAQGTSSREPADLRNVNGVPGYHPFDPLTPLPSTGAPPAIAPRMTPLTETVSVHALLVPAGAVKEFQRSLKAVRSGDFSAAADHLQKAIRIHPDFVEAHNNLGASYLQLKQYERAVSEFQLSIALDPKLQETHRNLGLGLFLMRRYTEAEIAARQALGLDPRRGTARYTLGRILAAEGSSSAEAEQLLRQSLADFPDSRLPLAQVLLNRGAKEQAADELRTYLQSPDANPDVRQAVQCWVAKISGNDGRAVCGGRQSD
jgi:tetratricopeptide (TPR) repeat protein